MIELSTMALAFWLGIKHSFDIDHLVAVSNLLSKAESLVHSIKMAASWAIGHMLTAVIVTAIIVALKDSLLTIVFEKSGLLVAIMLILLGVITLYKSRLIHQHVHEHNGNSHEHIHWHVKKEGENHSHKHMFGIGIIQGLASNDELLILIAVSLGLTGIGEIVLNVGIFSIGVVIGMILYSIALTYPLLKTRKETLGRAIEAGVGTISVIYGVIMLITI